MTSKEERRRKKAALCKRIDAAMKQNATIAEVLAKTFVEGRQ